MGRARPDRDAAEGWQLSRFGCPLAKLAAETVRRMIEWPVHKRSVFAEHDALVACYGLWRDPASVAPWDWRVGGGRE